MDYSEWKDGIREEGLTYSVTSFGQKIGTGLGTAALGWILAAGNYNVYPTVRKELDERRKNAKQN